MLELATNTESVAGRLESTLGDGLKSVGIEVQVEVESIPTTRLARAMVVSPQWSHLAQLERQEVVWRIVDRQFTRDEQLLIGSIWTLTPDELEDS